MEENRGWKIRYRVAAKNIPLHQAVYGNSVVHKLCVHDINKKCIQDPFWGSIYHHSAPLSQLLYFLHEADDAKDSIVINADNQLTLGLPTITIKQTTLYIRRLKCLMVGDKEVGKGTLINSLSQMKFTPGSSSAIQKCKVNVMVHRRILSFQIDMESDMDKISLLASEYDVILLCFSACNVQSFKNVPAWCKVCKEKLRKQNVEPPKFDTDQPEHEGLWKELSTKIALIGTHLDVALDKKVNQELLVSFREADRMAASIGANIYRECSSKNMTGIADLFVAISQLFTPLEKLGPELVQFGPDPMPLNYKQPKSCIIQ